MLRNLAIAALPAYANNLTRAETGSRRSRSCSALRSRNRRLFKRHYRGRLPGDADAESGQLRMPPDQTTLSFYAKNAAAYASRPPNEAYLERLALLLRIPLPRLTAVMIAIGASLKSNGYLFASFKEREEDWTDRFGRFFCAMTVELLQAYLENAGFLVEAIDRVASHGADDEPKVWLLGTANRID